MFSSIWSYIRSLWAILSEGEVGGALGEVGRALKEVGGAGFRCTAAPP